MQTLVLTVHIAAGSLGLVLGPVVMWLGTRQLQAGRRGLTPMSDAYIGAVLMVCLSAVVLVVQGRPDLAWLITVAVFSAFLVVLARVAATRRFAGWTHAYVHGQGGSYISLVTALLVVALTVGGPVGGTAQVVPWVLPTLIGVPLVEWWRRRLTP
ncbi:MAG: hypothetical protein ACR2GX_04060 [Candidatus Dormibacteria bacterium]